MRVKNAQPPNIHHNFHLGKVISPTLSAPPKPTAAIHSGNLRIVLTPALFTAPTSHPPRK